MLLVLLWHLYFVAPRAAWAQGLPVVDWFTSQGWAGVNLFFVLSGFLLGRILLQHRGDPGYFSAFYIRRGVRILPLYFLCLGFLWLFRTFTQPDHNPVLHPLLGDQTVPLWTYPLFLQNLFMARGSMGCEWLAVTWSLAVEEQFYLVLPFALARIPLKHVGTVAIATIAGAFSLRFASFLTAPDQHLAVSVLLPTRIDGFAFGILVADLLEHGSAATIKRALVCFWCFGVAAHTSVSVFLPGTVGASRASLYALIDTSYYAICAGLVIAAAACTNHPLVSILFGARPLTWLGQTSYFLYLFHLPVQSLVHWAVAGARPTLETPEGVICSSLALVLLFAMAEFSRRFVEQPLIRLGHRRGKWT